MISYKTIHTSNIQTYMVILKNIDVCVHTYTIIYALNNNEKQGLKFEREQ